MTQPRATAAQASAAAAVTLFLPCPQGVEGLLVDEVRGLLGPDALVEAGRGGAFATGDSLAAMRLNLESRLATRVLWPLAEGPYRDELDLYALA
ncbi:MAG: hypothetical protein JNN03_19105, partial [Rubrivivax sp.]|nr:hypothetical protein [Rubrivivax sp.]